MISKPGIYVARCYAIPSKLFPDIQGELQIIPVPVCDHSLASKCREVHLYLVTSLFLLLAPSESPVFTFLLVDGHRGCTCTCTRDLEVNPSVLHVQKIVAGQK